MTSSKTVVPIYILVYNDKYTFGLAKHIGNRQIDDDDFWKFTRLDYELQSLPKVLGTPFNEST